MPDGKPLREGPMDGLMDEEYIRFLHIFHRTDLWFRHHGFGLWVHVEQRPGQVNEPNGHKYPTSSKCPMKQFFMLAIRYILQI